MPSGKRFSLLFLLLTLIPVYAIVGYNIWNDTSGLFNTDFSVPRPEPSQHFIKMRYLIENPDKYDAYCFGSSRVGNIDLKKIEDGHRYYNMTYAAGVPAEWRDDLILLLRHHVTIHKILIGLDDLSFREDPTPHKKDLVRVPYQENNLKTYLTFLFRTPSKPYRFTRPPKGDYEYMHHSIYDIYDSGRPLHDAPDKRIEANLEGHRIKVANSVAGIDYPYYRQGKIFPYRVPQALEELQEIKNLCDENSIELIVFINPHSAHEYEFTDPDRFSEFRQGLAKITDYYDFSGFNEITTNDYYFYEWSHYRPIAGDLIIHRIFEMPKEAETDFGRYVKQEQ
ncbi:hypothetical protein [uncultured Selenomonas sp.]|uniref:hypothetical protein n=1 Tax=uncultured Selenomonas sp. TaxID=159275 RepID=UPI0025DA2878|nr:hypothetical protein [uncultured Selenomonas sp.]